MALKEYTTMTTKDWLQAASTAYKAYVKARSGNQAGSDDEEEECNGIIQVGGYTRSDGAKVGAYERICPYHYQGGKREKEEEANKNKEQKFSLTKGFSSDGNSSSNDVIKLKTYLNKMNYYKPEHRSETEDKFHGYPNDGLVDAIKNFQKDNGLTATGKIFPGDSTESAINSKFESHGVTFEYPVNTNKNQIAIFDGKSLTLYENDKKVKSWDGMSGKPDYQGKENQGLKNKGPLPEGTYVARQSNLYYFDDMSKIERMAAYAGRTKFPGGRRSWGNSKVALEPSPQNNMLGRGKFNIHGGKTLGSKGCIDLTSQMDDFTKWFENDGKDLIIRVQY